MTIIRVHRGAELEFAWPVFAPDGTTPLDMTSWAGEGWVRDVYQDQFLIPDLAPFMAFDVGKVSLVLPGDINGAWAWERGVFKIDVVDLDGRVAPLDSGLVLVTDF